MLSQIPEDARAHFLQETRVLLLERVRLLAWIGLALMVALGAICDWIGDSPNKRGN
jgi:hypothetical protein